ncbi:hypothetical protein IEQ34_003435 [Dendrobium chrysotoxum]|uniref:RING-type E3 ubiquitin transferase n=1 Tax=Dendrobium chrysotoxum TaxID=161865 RepID=A0AAV7HHM5_DENCH|nr:hypothetical protein IEQ34_003435 [Dendrobium chrysotoxum]
MLSKSRYFPCSNCIVLFTILFSSTTAAAASFPKISYVDHCGSIVPQYPSTGTFLSHSKFFELSYGHYSGGEKLFAAEPDTSIVRIDHSDIGYFNFRATYIQKTKSSEILQLGGSLSFQGPQVVVKSRRRGRHHQSFFLSSTVHTRKYVNFQLSGFWSESTGMICMVGTGSSHAYEGNILHLSAVFKLYYPKMSNISNSIVSGTLESLDPGIHSLNYFEKISISAYAQMNYSYTHFPTSIRDSCSNIEVPKETSSFVMDSVSSSIRDLLAVFLKLEHGSDCSGRNCYPFSLKKDSIPSFLSLNQMYFSEEGKFHARIGFYNHSRSWLDYQFLPEDSLVGEGFWDHEKNQMCLVACQVLANASVGDCTVGLSLWFPLVFTIKSRSRVIGRIWSNKNKNDPGYFSTMSFRDSGRYQNLVPGIKYQYSVLEGISGCDAIENSAYMGSRTYPDGILRHDMSFSMFSVTKGGSSASGEAYPLSIGDTVFVDSFVETQMDDVNATLRNVSYEISYWSYTDSSSSSDGVHTKISAEGVYNSRNGHLCMVGCMFNESSVLDKQEKIEDMMDCKILINIQFPPMDPKEGEHLNGTIRSTREMGDPLYFEPVSVSSYKMYAEQATESIWRIDIEIIIVVISLTLSCIFIRSQILHAKKNPDVLPAISITMLVVMSLGFVITLILNFEAMLIMVKNKQNFFSNSGEWMVVKEVIVRVLTLVAFILHLRMLQVAWSARCADEGKKDFSVAEQKTMKLCLILYFSGAVIAWLVKSKSRSHWWNWEDLLSYAGFILDGFLFPQILLNLFRRSHEKALSVAFYVGMTAIRIFPHVYDLYRAQTTLPRLQFSYIYASPQVDFYSLSWNIIIPLVGILLATSIFLQQRYGGNYLLPLRLRKQGGYETIAELNL